MSKKLLPALLLLSASSVFAADNASENDTLAVPADNVAKADECGGYFETDSSFTELRIEGKTFKLEEAITSCQLGYLSKQHEQAVIGIERNADGVVVNLEAYDASESAEQDQPELLSLEPTS